MKEPKAEIITDKDLVTSEMLKDGLENLIAGLGNANDKRTYSEYTNKKRLSHSGNAVELNALYRTNWIFGKIVDIIPDDMTREWRKFNGEVDPDIIKVLEDEEDRLQLSNKFNLAHKWARLYGTSFIVIVVDDGNTPDKPLEISKIKKGSLRLINVVDRHRLSHNDSQPITDPMSSYFGMPEKYRFNESSTVVHCSRMLRFDGIRLPYQEFRENNYFSDSIGDRLYDAITNFDTTCNSASSMVYETNVDIVKIKNMMSMLSNPQSEALLLKRLTLANRMKSFNNMLILDTDEETTSKTNTFAGLPDLIDRFALFLSSASDVPATRLLGSSASGLNATGEGDLNNYYNTVRSTQKKEYKPLLDYFDKILAKHLGLPDDADLDYKFNPLHQETQSEKALREKTEAERDAIHISNGTIDELVSARQLKESGTYTNIDDHIESLEEILEFGNGEDDELGDLNGSTTNTENPDGETEQETQEGEQEKTEE